MSGACARLRLRAAAPLVAMAGGLYNARPDGTPDRQSAVSAPGGAAPVVVAEGLGRRFGQLDAVRDLSLQIEDRQIFGFLGPNGAGKTTTIKMLCGLLRPTGGHALVVGFDVASQHAQIKRHTGYMAQTFSLYPDLTVEENFRFFAGVYGVYGRAAAHRMDDLFEQIELDELRGLQAGRLSGGMKQRLGLACALVHRPRLVFLDEPTAGVDPAQRQRVWNFLYTLCDAGTALFVTTHYLDEAERCHAVGFMLDGRLIARGTPASMREQLRDQVVGVEVRQAVDAMHALRAVPGVEDVTIHGHELRVFFARPVDAGTVAESLRAAAARAGAPLERVYSLTPTLEDLFMTYSRRGTAGR
jgi:drug efflux transport system ATP-binding protein